MYIMSEIYYDPTWDKWRFAEEYLKKIQEGLLSLGIDSNYKDRTSGSVNVENESQVINAGMPSWCVLNNYEQYNFYNYIDGGKKAGLALWWSIEGMNYIIFTNPDYFGMSLMVVPSEHTVSKYKVISSRYGSISNTDKLYKVTLVKTDEGFTLLLYDSEDNIYMSGGGCKTYDNMNGDRFNLLNFDLNNKPNVSGLGVTIKTSMLEAIKDMYSVELGDRILNKTPVGDMHIGFKTYGYYGIVRGIFDTSNKMYKQGEILNIGGENYVYIPQWQPGEKTGVDKWWLLKC